MSRIRRISDLRNTTEISELCHSKQEPVLSTKMDLYNHLAQAEIQIENGVPLLDAEKVFAKLRTKYRG